MSSEYESDESEVSCDTDSSEGSELNEECYEYTSRR